MVQPGLNPEFLWHVSVGTNAEAEEAVSEALERWSGSPAVTFRDQETQLHTVSVYLTSDPNSHGGRSSLRFLLEQIAASGLNPSPARISIRRIRSKDWAEAWKRHFPAVNIGPYFLIKPGWNRRRPKPGQMVIRLDPGLSFGTGHHPTTRFCLLHLAQWRNHWSHPAFLDVGTGSGLLAIGAAKMHYAPIHAFDFDRDAVQIARENASLNAVASSIHFYQADIREATSIPGRKFEVVGANLTADLLDQSAPRLVQALKPGGILLLAGILDREFADLQTRFCRLGVQLVADAVEQEWHSGSFQFAEKI